RCPRAVCHGQDRQLHRRGRAVRLTAVTIALVLAIGSHTAGAEPRRPAPHSLVGPLLRGPPAGGPSPGRPGRRRARRVWGGGPERLTIGAERRGGKLFGYLELDPWLYVGGTVGFGYDQDGELEPVLGLWEGVPVHGMDCVRSRPGTPVTISIGYRYTGVHE